jgi:hypothetical protein
MGDKKVPDKGYDKKPADKGGYDKKPVDKGGKK